MGCSYNGDKSSGLNELFTGPALQTESDRSRVVATGVYKTSVITPQWQFMMHLGFLPHLLPPLGIKRRSKFSFLLMANVWVRSRGKGQGAHMVKELRMVTHRRALLFSFLEDQRHQDNYLTSLITSSSPWDHYSFENGRHFHGKLPQHEWRDKDLPLLLLYGASWHLCSGWGNAWRSQTDAKKPTKAKQLCSAAASVLLNHNMDVMQFNAPIFQICI